MLLSEFLTKRGIYQIFTTNCRNYDNVYNLDKFINNPDTEAITNAFYWKKTLEKFSYWDIIDTAWREQDECINDLKEVINHNVEQNTTIKKSSTISNALEKNTTIDTELYKDLVYLGLIDAPVRTTNEGTSNYSEHIIQPWSIWLDYPNLTSWDHDIIKRVLRVKEGDTRSLDYDKIIHICHERKRQLNGM